MPPYLYDNILYARKLAYHMKCDMENSIEACHRLFGTEKPMYDQLYMMDALPYGNLQKEYKNVVLDN